MQKQVFTFILLCVSFIQYGQIIADHTVVEDYVNIPQYYIDKVKKMYLSVPGESHSEGYRIGLNNLETLDSKFQVVTGLGGYAAPLPYTDKYLRADYVVMGNVAHPDTWWNTYGELDWYKDPSAISTTEYGITWQNENGYYIDAMGFAWCWDGEEWEDDMVAYLSATQAYIDYCTSKGYTTKIFYTTGPVDNGNYTAIGETGYHKYLAYEAIRDYVNLDPKRILFDYADILSYDTPTGSPNTTTWNGHTFPIITATNLGDGSIAHIGSEGVLKLAKAMWWMLARIAGWDGGTTNVENIRNGTRLSSLIEVTDDELRIKIKDASISYKICLYNLHGSLLLSRMIDSDYCIIKIADLPAGVYLVVISNSKFTQTQKVIIS